MKHVLTFLFLAFMTVTAQAGCDGIFATGTFCGNTTGSSAPPGPTAITGVLSVGGTNGQIQYNNAGAFGGFTPTGDVAITPSTGATLVNKINNVPVNPASSVTNDILYYNGSSYVHTALITLINTVCTATPNLCNALFGYYSPMWYGAVCDNATDDKVALQAAVTAAGGKALFVPSGYTCVTSAVLTIGADNTVIRGAGRDVSGFKSTISNRGAIFYAANRQGITITDLALTGTRTVTAWTLPSFGAIDIEQDNAAASTLGRFTFRNLKLSGFNATYWMQISLGNSAFDMTNLVIDNILAVTVSADIPTDPTPANNGNYVLAIYGGTTGPAVRQTLISNMTIEGTGVCFGIGLYNTHSGFAILDNKLLNIGATSTVAHCTNGIGFTNSYPIFVYDIPGAGFPATGGLISGNYILTPYSAGVYTVGATNATLAYNDFNTIISNNICIGQSQSDLPIRGCFVLNNYTNSMITGNRCYNSWACIVTSGQYIGQVTVSNNDCVTNVTGGTCWAVAGATGTTGNVPIHLVKNNNFNTTGTSSATTKITADASHYLGSIYFSGNFITASVTGATFSGLFANGSLTVNNNNFTGAGTLLTVSGLTGATLTLLGNTGVSFTAATLPTATNGSSVFVSDGTPATACTAAGTGSTAFRQNSAWKCF